MSEPYILEDPARGLFQVNRRTFVEPHVLEEEKRLIFDRCWLYVAHESEVPLEGDFLRRDVGGRELIFVRGRDGEARAFLNTCPHRGAMVCRETHGNANMFRCFYHSWAFDLQGKLVNRPEADRYNSNVEPGTHDMVPVPRLDSYRGLYFVCFDSGVEDLDSYLADAKEYIDLTMDHSEVGMEIVGGIQEYGFDANWKLLAENSFDGYHGFPTHASYFDYLTAAGGQLGENVSSINAPRDLGNGHAVIEYGAPWGRPVAKAVSAWGEQGITDTKQIYDRLVERFGLERADRIAYNNFNLVIFPNLVLNNIMAVTLRTFYPQSPGKQHVKAWALAPKEETAEMRKRRLSNFLDFLGPGGFATPDDCEALRLCQLGYQNLKEASWNDISKGMGQGEQITTDEEQMRIFWRRWDLFMSESTA